MSGKSLRYWENKFDQSTRYFDGEDQAATNAWKALDLLSQYSAFYKTIPILGLQHAWGGSIGRFFSGRWNTHHGNEVQRAISNYFEMDGWYALDGSFHSVEFILALVKLRIKSNPINNNGDLSRILEIIKNKTGIDYHKLDENSVYDRYITEANTRASFIM